MLTPLFMYYSTIQLLFLPPTISRYVSDSRWIYPEGMLKFHWDFQDLVHGPNFAVLHFDESARAVIFSSNCDIPVSWSKRLSLLSGLGLEKLGYIPLDHGISHLVITFKHSYQVIDSVPVSQLPNFESMIHLTSHGWFCSVVVITFA